jgi:hypothetical protein
MSTVFRIHPGIGVARVGNSTSSFFVGPELPGRPGFELDSGGGDGGTVTELKDASGRVKRQAARFSVWEYLRNDATGAEDLVGEVPGARVEWHVSLANTKAAGARIWSDGSLRNQGPRGPLSIAPSFPAIFGPKKTATASVAGTYKNIPVSLGELRTDAAGRLLVLGGSGRAESPSNVLITSFANNSDWFDDVSDGPVDAIVHFPNGTTQPVDRGAWVIVGPPDFAPEVRGITTLYDVALDAAVRRGWIAQPATPSYRDHILPILERVSALRFVNRFALWNQFPRDFALLGTRGTPASDAARGVAHALLVDVQDSGVLDHFEYTPLQRALLDLWRVGTFVSDFGSPAPQPARSPSSIDRAALDAAVGGGFLPGIEMGIMCTNPALYDEPFRLTRAPFHDDDPSVGFNGNSTLRAGSISERMACPWQADFLKCQGNWWPAQRPDRVMSKATVAQPNAVWDEGITSHEDLVANFWKLGFVTTTLSPAGEAVYVETERDPSLPTR